MELTRTQTKLTAFQQRSFHCFLSLNANLNTFVAVSKDYGDNISDKFLCYYLKVTKDCKGVMFKNTL